MTVTVHNDACNVEGTMHDVSRNDVDQLRGELPIGWHIAGKDC